MTNKHRKPSEEPWDNDAQVLGAIMFVLACIVALVWQIVEAKR